MLLSFTVENFRSFAGEQTLSMDAGRFRSERVGTTIDSGFRGIPQILRSMAIMGGNGSGKSSLFRAIWTLQLIVDTSAQRMQKGDEFPIESFRLDKRFANRPTRFEIEFIHNDVFYCYSVSLSSKQIFEECLHSRRRGGVLREVFSRSRGDDGKYKWNLGRLPAERARLWRDSTRENCLFLSMAVQLNSEDLAEPFEWISDCLRVYHGGEAPGGGLTSHMIKDHVADGCRERILNLIRESDLGIRDIDVREVTIEKEKLLQDMPDEIKSRMPTDWQEEPYFETEFFHRDADGKNVAFDLFDESDGTQQIYALAGHLIYSLQHGVTLLIDEIDTSLHPLIVRMLIQMFQKPEEDSTQAQLIFTTHDAGILDSGILERDQFCFVEKRRGATQLIPLLDYRPRKGEAVRKNYLLGMYGGIPSISRVK